MAKRVSKGRGKRVAKRVARARRARAARMNSEHAACKVTHDLGYDSMGVVYKFSEFSLVGWLRAAEIAQFYQFYRINRIDMKFIPVADTYIAGNPGELPNLYYIIDKSDAFPYNGDITTLQNMGAKPIRFDDKTITKSFKPAVTWKALDENGTATNFGMTKVSPWLSTNNNNTSDTQPWSPSSVDHHGIVYSVQGGVAGANYRVEVTAHFEFKKPLYPLPAPGAVSVTQKVLPDRNVGV